LWHLAVVLSESQDLEGLFLYSGMDFELVRYRHASFPDHAAKFFWRSIAL
jgi:hypothetical protein